MKKSHQNKNTRSAWIAIPTILLAFALFMQVPARYEVQHRPHDLPPTKTALIAVYSPTAPSTTKPGRLQASATSPIVAVATAQIAGVTDAREVFKSACERRKLPSGCAALLFAMATVESNLNPQATGDTDRKEFAAGPFQIRFKLHGITEGCARDWECSTDWTLENLIRHGYPEKKSAATARHNGGGERARKYAVRVIALQQRIIQGK